MALGGTTQPLVDVVGVLELTAAWAWFLHRLVEGTYLAIPVLVVGGLGLRVDALVALEAALVLHLVLAHDLRAPAAAEALVGPLAVLVAVHEELGLRFFCLRLLARLVTDIVYRLAVTVIDALHDDAVRLVRLLVLCALVLIVAHPVRLLVFVQLTAHVLIDRLCLNDLGIYARRFYSAVH